MITAENAPVLQSLFTSVNKDKPDVGSTVRVIGGQKHKGKIGVVTKHFRDSYVNPYRYGSAMQHHMTDARGRYGYVVRIKQADGTAFIVKASCVMVCCTKEWGC